MSGIVSFGEMLMRLSPSLNNRILQANQWDLWYGGSEVNAVGTCADFGDDVTFITTLPNNEIGDCAINTLRSHGINTKYIVRSGERMGIYFMELGNSIRSSKVIYDRKNSSVSTQEPLVYDFQSAMQGKDWFHFTGITAAISDNALQALQIACKVAKENHLKISCDLNYRGKLWTPEQAQKTMVPLMKYVDVCIANEADVKYCLGIDSDNKNIEEVIYEIKNIFNFQVICSADLIEYSSSNNRWTGVMLYDNKIYKSAKNYDLNPIIDRTGVGDALSGGLIHALLKWKHPQRIIDFATVTGALKSTIKGDMNQAKEEEINSMLMSSTNGIQR